MMEAAGGADVLILMGIVVTPNLLPGLEGMVGVPKFALSPQRGSPAAGKGSEGQKTQYMTQKT